MCRNGARGVALALVLLALPGLARAYDEVKVTPSISVTQRYDSNVFNLDSGEKSDFSTVVQPQLQIAYDSERTHIQTNYRLQSSSYFEYSGLDAISHRFNFDASRSLTRRLRASFGANLRIEPKADAFQEDDIGFRAGRPDYDTLSTSVGLSYSLDPRSSLSLNLARTAQDYDPGEEDRRRLDTTTNSLSLSYQRSLSQRDSVGLSLSRTESVFERDPDRLFTSFSVTAPIPEVPDSCPPGFAGDFFLPSGDDFVRPCSGFLEIDESESVQHSLSTSWTRLWSPTWRSSLSLGLRRLASSGGDTQLSSSESDTSFTWTGSFTLTHTTKVSTLSLYYLRQTRPATGQAANVDVDFISLSYDRRLSSRLRLEGNVRWSHQQSVADLQAIDDESLRLGAAIHWRWKEDLSTFLRIGYADNTRRSRFRGDHVYDNYSMRIGFQYKFPLYLL